MTFTAVHRQAQVTILVTSPSDLTLFVGLFKKIQFLQGGRKNNNKVVTLETNLLFVISKQKRKMKAIKNASAGCSVSLVGVNI